MICSSVNLLRFIRPPFGLKKGRLSRCVPDLDWLSYLGGDQPLHPESLYVENFPELSSPAAFYKMKDVESAERQRRIMKAAGYDIWESRALPLTKIKPGDLFSYYPEESKNKLQEIFAKTNTDILIFEMGSQKSEGQVSKSVPFCEVRKRNLNKRVDDQFPRNFSVESVTFPVAVGQNTGVKIKFSSDGDYPLDSITCYLDSKSGKTPNLDSLLFIHLLLTIGIEARLSQV
jgi:hypothetical protein